MSRNEEIEKLLADVEPRLEALRESALEEIRQEQQRAEANVRRYDEAVRELLDVEAEISRLSAEREQLAFKTYRAWLDTDHDVTARLRASFRDLRSIIDGLQKRRASLKGELYRLSPRGQNHRDAAIEQLGRAASVASAARAELEELRDRLTQALDAMVQPVSDRHDALRGRVEQLGRDQAWEKSPVVDRRRARMSEEYRVTAREAVGPWVGDGHRRGPIRGSPARPWWGRMFGG